MQGKKERQAVLASQLEEAGTAATFGAAKRSGGSGMGLEFQRQVDKGFAVVFSPSPSLCIPYTMASGEERRRRA